MGKNQRVLSEGEQRFFRKADFFKILLFLTVVLTHSINYDTYPLRSNGFAGELLYQIQHWELIISGLTIPIYYCISGFSFFAGYEPSKTLSKWKRRIFSLFVPWVLWNTIMWALGLAMESIPAIASRLNSGFGYELSLRSWFIDGLIKSADGPMWFMLNLMVAVLLSPLLYYVLKNKYIGLAAIACAMVAVHFTGAYRYSILVTTIFYAEAAWYSMHAKDFVIRQYGRKERLLAALVLVVYLFIGRSESLQDGGLAHVLCFSVTSPAMWVLVGDAKLPRGIQRFEKHRFFVYAGHFLPLECLEKLWLIIGGTAVWAAWADFFFAPALVTLILITANIILEKLFRPLWCLLNGKKPIKAAP